MIDRAIRALLLSAVLLPLAGTLTAQQSDAYMDERARALVAGARQRRQTVDRSIDEYRAVSTERMSAGYRVIGRERLLFRRETATKIHWTRTGPIEIEVVGAREVVPIATSKVQIPTDLQNFVPHIAFDPMDSEFLLKLDSTSVIHPFSAAGEANYRFRSGDSTTIKLPDGRSVTLKELEFIPRRRHPELIAGAFWIDAATHAVVQAVFRLSRPFDFARDTKDEEKKGGDDPPGWLVPDIKADLSYLAVDYGLYDFRWWLPHYVAAEGVVTMGSFGSMPFKYERTYDGYEVHGDTLGVLVARDSTILRQCRPSFELSVSVSSDDSGAARDSSAAARRRERDTQRRNQRDSIATANTKRTNCVPTAYRITQAPDSVLLHSDLLPASVYAGETLLSEGEIESITDRIKDLPNVPWLFELPQLSFGLGGPGLVRYNRIEGLSVGARSDFDFGRLGASAELRFGTADERLGGEFALRRESTSRQYRLGAYKRLNATDATLRPFTLRSSVGSLVFGADDAQFFRSTGGEIVIAPAASKTQWYSLRAYTERQTTATKETDFSIRHLIKDDFVFSDNITADRATQHGGELTLRRDFGMNPAGLRAGAEVAVRGETGTFEFVRPTLTLRSTMPVAGFALAVEGAAGTSFGDVPAQSLWYLGGTSTLRGYRIGAASGNAFWRTRTEIASKFPGVRLALFSDAAWAGSRDEWQDGKPLLSAGIGASLMDGIVRVDVARALRGDTGWRLHVYMGGII